MVDLQETMEHSFYTKYIIYKLILTSKMIYDVCNEILQGEMVIPDIYKNMRIF